jgi:hypothetical protein
VVPIRTDMAAVPFAAPPCAMYGLAVRSSDSARAHSIEPVNFVALALAAVTVQEQDRMVLYPQTFAILHCQVRNNAPSTPSLFCLLRASRVNSDRRLFFFP